MLADRVASRIGARITVAAGFAISPPGRCGSADRPHRRGRASVVRVPVDPGRGVGIGTTLATCASVALVELWPAQRAGVGSAVMQTVQKVGAPLGAAILGSVLNARYRGELDLAGTPRQRRATLARTNVLAAIGVAQQLRSVGLLESAPAPSSRV